MKKIIALVLALILMVSVAPMAFASTTTLTTTVPEATYTLSIPADTTVPFSETDYGIGFLKVTESSGFGVGKNLNVTIEYGPFVHTENPDLTIAYSLGAADHDDVDPDRYHTNYIPSGYTLTFKGGSSGSVGALAYRGQNVNETHTYFYGELGVRITETEWGRALSGNYTSTITFTAEVVQEPTE